MCRRVINLTRKSWGILKTQGLRTLLMKGLSFLGRYFKSNRANDSAEYTYMDVLFINGCTLPHPTRYRVDHQKEQLYAYGVNSNTVFYEDITMDMVKLYRVFVFFRCPITDTIEEFIKRAKEFNKMVLYDIDDLVIDSKYTSQIEYLKTMSADDRSLYDEGVDRMQRLLRLCDAAITTTERLAEELKNYVPEVFINRNTASERMVELSNKAMLVRTEKKTEDGIVRVGYFSGSITHNDDIRMILPVLVRILTENPKVELHFCGELDVPEELKPFRSRLVAKPFAKWEKLPEYIAAVDVNIAPLEDTIFNEAKSENKWIEAALVRVPTVASRVGAFEKMIVDGQTGLLCANSEEWYKALSLLICDAKRREYIAKQAYDYVIKHCVTTYSGLKLTQYVQSKMIKNIAFVLPSVQTSGGVLVVLKHALMLRKAGYDVLLLSEGNQSDDVIKEGQRIPVISSHTITIHGSFDKAVATLWSTMDFIKLYPAVRERYYLVQNFETDFYQYGNFFRLLANQTYNSFLPVHYLTISKWCQNWLQEQYDKEARYTPNGLDLSLFYPVKRDFSARIRILVEGNSEDYYKNVDESFRIVDKLDPEKFEVWYMSYKGKPKDWYRVDRFLHDVPYEKVGDIYRSCHILIKSSILESFSYPPLEMMATGGYVVVSPNGGNIEYLENKKNCLIYESGNIDDAIAAINRLVSDNKIREILYFGGIETSRKRDWELLKQDIINLYS